MVPTNLLVTTNAHTVLNMNKLMLNEIIKLFNGPRASLSSNKLDVSNSMKSVVEQHNYLQINIMYYLEPVNQQHANMVTLF